MGYKNINQFISTIKRHGDPANASKFSMTIFPKPGTVISGLGGESTTRQTNNRIDNLNQINKTGDLSYMIDSVNLPGKTFINSDIRRNGYGFLERRPLHQTFSEVTITVIADQSGKAISFFNNWMDKTLATHEQLFTNKGITSGDIFKGYSSSVSYPSDYLCDMEIYVLPEAEGSQFDAHTTYKVFDVFPSAIGDVDLNWNNNNTIIRFPVTFQYKLWVHVESNTEMQGGGDTVIDPKVTDARIAASKARQEEQRRQEAMATGDVGAVGRTRPADQNIPVGT